MDVLHEQLELHLRGEVAAHDHRAAYLEHRGGGGARVEHIEGEVEIEPAFAGKGEGLSCCGAVERHEQIGDELEDRKSTRLNSSHLVISYAVFCLKKKKKK